MYISLIEPGWGSHERENGENQREGYSERTVTKEDVRLNKGVLHLLERSSDGICYLVFYNFLLIT